VTTDEFFRGEARGLIAALNAYASRGPCDSSGTFNAPVKVRSTMQRSASGVLRLAGRSLLSRIPTASLGAQSALVQQAWKVRRTLCVVGVHHLKVFLRPSHGALIFLASVHDRYTHTGRRACIGSGTDAVAAAVGVATRAAAVCGIC
jgi:hypothetical protein